MTDTININKFLFDTINVSYDTLQISKDAFAKYGSRKIPFKYIEHEITKTIVVSEPTTNSWLLIIIAILAVALIAILLYFLIPRKKIITIFLYGHSSSGKTSLIQSMIGMVYKIQIETENIHVYKAIRPLNKNSNQNVHLRIIDYRGQQPSQLMSQVQTMQLNSMLFIVDIAPAYSPENIKYTDEEVFNLMKENYSEIIGNRLKDHEEYMTKYLIQIVFDYALNPNLKNVYFIINKIDILTRLQEIGIFPKDKDVSEYIKSFFFKIEDDINSFCSGNNIADFNVYLVSSKHDTNVNKMFTDLIKAHS